MVPSAFFNYNLPWFILERPSLDYISPFPWIGCLFLGLYAQSVSFHKLPSLKNKLGKLLSKMGKHSLVIYLLHQPILFGIVFLAHKLKGLIN